MKRCAAVWTAIGMAVVAGVACACIATHSIALRDKLGMICGRGHLLALVCDREVYQADIDRSLREFDYLREIERSGASEIERKAAVTNLIANTIAVRRASAEEISRAKVEREVALLRSQFPSDKTWWQALNQSGLSARSVWCMLKRDLRSREWISNRIANQLAVTEMECRDFYESHLPDFFVPERIHASHLFLAAPPETAPKTIQEKQSAIQELSVRLAAGEDFNAVVAQNSEDEATKLRGGDLGWFTANRMPPDFIAAAMKLHPGEVSQPLQTRLGFHIAKLIETQPARQRSFDEVRGDIAIELANQKRATAMQKLIVDLAGEAAYRRPL